MNYRVLVEEGHSSFSMEDRLNEPGIELIDFKLTNLNHVPERVYTLVLGHRRPCDCLEKARKANPYQKFYADIPISLVGHKKVCDKCKGEV